MSFAWLPPPLTNKELAEQISMLEICLYIFTHERKNIEKQIDSSWNEPYFTLHLYDGPNKEHSSASQKDGKGYKSIYKHTGFYNPQYTHGGNLRLLLSTQEKLANSFKARPGSPTQVNLLEKEVSISYWQMLVFLCLPSLNKMVFDTSLQGEIKSILLKMWMDKSRIFVASF